MKQKNSKLIFFDETKVAWNCFKKTWQAPQNQQTTYLRPQAGISEAFNAKEANRRFETIGAEITDFGGSEKNSHLSLNLKSIT